MKKLLIASAAVIALGVASAHADSPFDGPYAGVQGGYGHVSPDAGDKDGAFSGGGFAGYGKTFDNIYLGAEASVGFNGAEFSSGGVTYSRKLEYGVTAKAGYVLTPKYLVYGLAGYERADMEADSGGTVTKGTNDGFRFGIGAETFVTKKLTARSEVSYTDWHGRDGMPEAGEWKGLAGIGIRF